MELQTAEVAPSRFALVPDPVTIGLSMVNWLVLMLLMSGFLLAATASDDVEPVGGTHATATR